MTQPLLTGPTDIHSKILAFLIGELARKAEYQCKSITLLRGKGTAFNDEIRSWSRVEHPDRFELSRTDPTGKVVENPIVHSFANELMNIAAGEAQNSSGSKHRFTLRSEQVYGPRQTCGFTIVTSDDSESDENDLSPTVAGQTGLMMRGFDALLRANKDMHSSTISIVGGIAQKQMQELIELRKTNDEQRRKIADLEADKTEREYSIYKDQLADNRTKQGMDRLFQIGTVALASLTQGKLGAVGNAANGADGSSPLVMLLREFFNSVTPPQQQALMQTFQMEQLMMLQSISTLCMPQPDADQPPPNGANTSPNGANGASHGAH